MCVPSYSSVLNEVPEEKVCACVRVCVCACVRACVGVVVCLCLCVFCIKKYHNCE